MTHPISTHAKQAQTVSILAAQTALRCDGENRPTRELIIQRAINAATAETVKEWREVAEELRHAISLIVIYPSQNIESEILVRDTLSKLDTLIQSQP